MGLRHSNYNRVFPKKDFTFFCLYIIEWQFFVSLFLNVRSIFFLFVRNGNEGETEKKIHVIATITLKAAIQLSKTSFLLKKTICL